MARQTVEEWIVEEYDSTVIRRIASTSVVEARFTGKPMNSDAKRFPRSGGMSSGIVGKGAAYGEDVAVNDTVLIEAVKFGRVRRFADEDIDDSFVNLLDDSKLSWASNHAVMLDNACLATNVAANGSTVPFNSIYRALSVANAATAYVAGANIVATAAGVVPTYDNIVTMLSKVETGRYWSKANGIIIADTSFLATLRLIKDANGLPIFTSNPRAGEPDTLFGYPLVWSNGARLSATATSDPTGAAIMVAVNPDYAFRGDRKPVETVVIDGKDGAAALTDETLLKIRTRKGFVLAHEKAAAILVATPAI